MSPFETFNFDVGYRRRVTTMDFNLYQTLGQVSSDDAGEIFRDHLRGFVREMISDVMASEVTELCGSKHNPSGSEYIRVGSS